MEIRHVIANDTSSVSAIANSIRLDPRKPQESGFLIYVLDRESYSRRIASSRYFLVAQEKNDVIGFAMCYDTATLLNLRDQGELSHEDKIVDFLARQGGSFIFCDQIGIEFQHARKCVGESLMRKVFQEMRRNNISNIYAIISHKPLKNEASVAFFKKIGFRFTMEIENNDGRIFGLYQKTTEGK
jgi:L-amino acid N-acyltransferase YncA